MMEQCGHETRKPLGFSVAVAWLQWRIGGSESANDQSSIETTNIPANDKSYLDWRVILERGLQDSMNTLRSAPQLPIAFLNALRADVSCHEILKKCEIVFGPLKRPRQIKRSHDSN